MTGRTATVIYASGDGYGDGTGFESFDLQKPYVELWLTFIGFEKIEKVIADRTRRSKSKRSNINSIFKRDFYKMKKIMFYVLTTLILFNITELKKILVTIINE